MVFLPLILLGLGIAFSYSAYHKGDKLRIVLAITFVTSALGTALITYFALSAID